MVLCGGMKIWRFKFYIGCLKSNTLPHIQLCNSILTSTELWKPAFLFLVSIFGVSLVYIACIRVGAPFVLCIELLFYKKSYCKMFLIGR